MIESTLLVALVASVALLVWTYFLYPAFLFVWVSLTSDTDRSEPDELPSVALVIAAYNEEEVIAEKIENSLDLAYPDDRFSIVVFSDASSDRTDEIVRSYESEGVKLIRIEGRVGKTECQNRVAERLDEEIIAFSDANSMYEPDAIMELVRGFDSEVGCVVGELKYRDSSDVEGESLYWKYESAIKQLESTFHSTVAGNGAIYAVRNSSYVPLSRDTISDFAEPLAIVSNGEKAVYAKDATAWESTAEQVEEELSRRSRIATRSWHTIAKFSHLLNPVSYPLFSLQLFSHKILRWLSPILLAGTIIANLGLVLVSPSPVYVVLLGAQILFYSLAAIGAVHDRMGLLNPIVTYVPYYFLTSNYGMLIGLWNFVVGQNIVTWDTATRKTN
ncbi:glycosyltransferase family 2 protein [Halostagnicola sp. A-GB9-2]|uniref:glycosyltransferase family 2 protein n=1 Tax=Halostagnicola sp. A-GB9-2 TaxID=3048066 RepID=UPI0024BF16A2|nr:glycosyltransferase family 2 protein [Halostagnicola sp. A-GB9-2]MDJ1433103.1 glycosyltransferase family 2 protein [Halostagnicola sp. A-GB9-2]